jgi:hypothetical protein
MVVQLIRECLPASFLPVFLEMTRVHGDDPLTWPLRGAGTVRGVLDRLRTEDSARRTAGGGTLYPMWGTRSDTPSHGGRQPPSASTSPTRGSASQVSGTPPGLAPVRTRPGGSVTPTGRTSYPRPSGESPRWGSSQDRGRPRERERGRSPQRSGASPRAQSPGPSPRGRPGPAAASWRQAPSAAPFRPVLAAPPRPRGPVPLEQLDRPRPGTPPMGDVRCASLCFCCLCWGHVWERCHSLPDGWQPSQERVQRCMSRVREKRRPFRSPSRGRSPSPARGGPQQRGRSPPRGVGWQEPLESGPTPGGSAPGTPR